MSALGHKRTLKHVRLMSALPPKADILHCDRDVRFVPIADIPAMSFDYLIGKRDECWRDFEAQSLGGLKIEHEFELGRLYDR
jgi:hypothetical protein